MTISKLGEIIKSRGGQLAAGFTVPMPDNSDPCAKEKQQKLFVNWKKKLEMIHQYVDARKKGKYENTVLYNIIMTPFMAKQKRTTLKLLTQLSDSSGLPLKELLPLTDRSFLVDDKCNGCGICARTCPAGNIEIVDKKPVWQNRCESCLACVNWCPKEAIQGSITTTNKKTARYHHPDVKVKDMLGRD